MEDILNFDYGYNFVKLFFFSSRVGTNYGGKII